MEDADTCEDELYFSEEADNVYTVHYWISNFHSYSTQWKLCLFAKGSAKKVNKKCASKLENFFLNSSRFVHPWKMVEDQVKRKNTQKPLSL